ncbi:MAG: efflux RND transporter permease subunit [Gammaproteobacteria bacterium]|nr:efflux RND transporter permease subunit [Gammaproteobacteria bacterium]
MNIAQYSIEKRVISWTFAIILLFGGFWAFNGLGRLEDPAFTIKDAMVITAYPGGSPLQVEEEVSYPLEKAILELPYVDKIRSTNTQGLSQIQVTMRNIYGPDQLPQIWDELRRKVNDLTPYLPPGVQAPRVIDDFGDVYGILLTISGDGYSYRELSDYIDFLKRELELVDGVAKISLAGTQQEQVQLELSMTRLTTLGISPDTIYNLLNSQNQVSSSGGIRAGSEYIVVEPTGDFTSVESLGELVITRAGSDKLIYLKDIATIRKGYKDLPSNLINFNGSPAISLGIAFGAGVNVVDVGTRVSQRLAELDAERPVGIHIGEIYFQPKEVDKSISAFVLNLIEAVVIVVVVLLLFMGLRSGLLIGLILLLTVLGTFLVMKFYAIDLQRISLGALIIALGMLVDNAIVVTEGILIGQQQGKTKLQAASAVVKQTIWPLLGATVIAVLAFAPIGLSPDSTGEFAGSLFWVLLISLMFSWLTAITLTPFFANLIFKETTANTGDQQQVADPYASPLFVRFRLMLDWIMHHRGITMASVLVLFVASLFGFGYVKQSFFPPSVTPIYLVDVWMPQGTDIRATYATVKELEKLAMANDATEYVMSTTGQGAQRFMLTYAPEKSYAAYAQLLVRMSDFDEVDPAMRSLRQQIESRYPQVNAKFKRLEIGPSPAAKIEARFIGADPDVLRSLGQQAIDILRAAGGTVDVRHNWRERVKIARPEFNETQARRLGITKADFAATTLMALEGRSIGLYRDGTTMLPIVTRLPDEERDDMASLYGLTIWSPVKNSYIPLRQLIVDSSIGWEDAIIERKERKRTLTVLADPDFETGETAANLHKRISEAVEAIPLPQGYEFQWGGEFESSRDAQKALFASLPLGFLMMFLVTVFLFDSIRKPLAIWACVPLAIIGITAGLLLMNKPFSFMALLGMLSLSGMLLKNGIVLLDQINTELADGKEPYMAVIDSTISRVRPVSMAAVTTILGMIPLIVDPFFESMAAVIMFGLGVATILTLVVVPVLYTLLFGIKPPPQLGQTPNP